VLAAGHGSGHGVKALSKPGFLPAKYVPARSHAKGSKVDFTITAFRTEAEGSSPDWSFKSPSLSTASAGSGIDMSAYVRVTSAPPNSVARAVYTVRNALSSQPAKYRFSWKLGANPVGVWWLEAGWVLGSAGSYAFSISLTINHSAPQTALTALNVK
jgi:hypothetical protein